MRSYERRGIRSKAVKPRTLEQERRYWYAMGAIRRWPEINPQEFASWYAVRARAGDSSVEQAIDVWLSINPGLRSVVATTDATTPYAERPA